jgi:hypothetical protein
MKKIANILIVTMGFGIAGLLIAGQNGLIVGLIIGFLLSYFL